MADIKQIQFKRSEVAGRRPLPADIAVGELALNLNDRTIFSKNAAGQVIDLGFAKGGDITGNVTHTGDYTQTGNTTINGKADITGKVTVGSIGDIIIDSPAPKITGKSPTGTWEITTEDDTPVFPKVKLVSATIAAIVGPTTATDLTVTDLKIINALAVTEGGTGARTADTARINLVAAKSGRNSDITGLTGLVGPLTLGSDPVGATDATTKRYVDNLVAAGGGGSGATMNGIMNFGVGTPLMAASRAFIQPTDVTQDGQLLSRTEYAELWVFAQMTTPISDVDWLADPSKRGSYSDGDGSTTFRVPDWNGVQPDSIPGVFFRGGNGSYDMTIALSASPNIKGITGSCDNELVSGNISAPFYRYSSSQRGSVNDNTGGVLGFDASLSSEVYGRYDTEEVVPNKVSGVWCVRARGGFIAANTSWSVMNAVANTTPGQIVLGGKVISQITADNKESTAMMEIEKTIDLKAAIRFSIKNADNVNTTVWRMEETGRTTNIVANGGANNNITSLTALAGPLRLGGDPISALDAATKRYVDNAVAAGGGGGGGPTMNGIMNNGIGTPGMAASRAFIQPYDLPQDGQLVLRADYPELWAFAQMLTPISDADWLGLANNRGRYSHGDGSTTFRLPDWNGVQPGSITAPFMRGTNGGDGVINQAAVPNLKGQTNIVANGAGRMFMNTAWDTPPFYRAPNNTDGFRDGFITENFVGAGYTGSIGFNAELSDPVFGRYGVRNDLFPNHINGVYVVRARGSFTAANTIWQVISAEDSVPVAGSTVAGGSVVSKSQVAGNDYVDAVFRGYSIVDGNAAAEIAIIDNRNSASPVDVRFTFDSLGGLHVPGGVNVGLDVSANDVYIRSDKKVKRGFNDFENPEETLSKMNGLKYEIKVGDEWKQSAGLIAQEVQAQLPELVTEDKDSGLLRLNYNGVVALNTATINKHTKRINELESLVKELQAKLK